MSSQSTSNHRFALEREGETVKSTVKPQQKRSNGFAVILAVIMVVIAAFGATRVLGGASEPARPPVATQSASQPVQITVGFIPVGKVAWTGLWQIGSQSGPISHDSGTAWQVTRSAKVGDYVNLQVNPPAGHPPTIYLYCFILRGESQVPVRADTLERREISCNLTYIVEAV